MYVKLTPVFVSALLLLSTIGDVSICNYSSGNVIKNQLEEKGAPVAAEKTLFYNFTSDHLFVDDRGDWVSEGIDIRKTYVACDGEFIYILWVTPSTGSHGDIIYFDVGEENGYPIGVIKASYLFACGWTPWSNGWGGIGKWDGTEFQLLIPLHEAGSNFWQSEDGRVAQHIHARWDEPQEYWELKIALSVFGYPSIIRMVRTIKYAGNDQAPDDSYILIFSNQSRSFVASFYAKTSDFEGRLREIRKESIGYYGSEGFNVSLKVMNFGNSSLELLDIHLDLPQYSGANLNKTLWNISLGPKECWNLQFELKPGRLGRFTLATAISYNASGNGFYQVVPLVLFVIPKMNVSIQYPQQMKAGFPNELNITIINYEAINAEVSVLIYGQYEEYWYFTPLTLELGPISSVKVKTEIIPLAIINPEDITHNYSFLELALDFEDFSICSSGSFPFPGGPIEIIEPDIRIIIQYPKEVVVGETFYVNISAVNNEDEEVMVSFKVKLMDWYSTFFSFEGDSKYEEQIIPLSPGSDITFSFKFEAIKESPPYGTPSIHLYVRHGFYGDDYYPGVKTVSSWTRLWPTIQALIIATILALGVGLVVFYWKKKKFKLTKDSTLKNL